MRFQAKNDFDSTSNVFLVRSILMTYSDPYEECSLVLSSLLFKV